MEWDEHGNPIAASPAPQPSARREWDEHGREVSPTSTSGAVGWRDRLGAEAGSFLTGLAPGAFLLDKLADSNVSLGPVHLGAAAAGADDALTYSFGDELRGLQAGLVAAISGRDALGAYRDRVDQARQRLADARAAHPISTLGGSLVGAVASAPVAEAAVTHMPFGAALTEYAAGRGLSALGSQMALGGATGALAGGVYGAGAGDYGDRFESARNGALWGGVLGAAAPPAFQALGHVGRAAYQNPAARTAIGAGAGGLVGYLQGDTPEERQQNALYGAGIGAGLGLASRPALAAVGRAWRDPIGAFSADTARGGQTGMSLGLPPIADDAAGGAGGGPAVPANVVSSVDRLLGRQRMSVDQLENTIDLARSNPLGRTLADVGGEQFLSKADALANLPGQTGPRAVEIAEARARALPAQITDDLQLRLGVSQSPTQAMKGLEDQYAEVSRDLYEPLLQAPLDPADVARLDPILQRFPKRVMDRAESTMEDLARIDGIAVGDLKPAQRLHYLKMGLDDAIQGLQQTEGLGGATRAGLKRLKGEFLRVVEGDPAAGIEPVLPGYRQARQQWGGLKEAEEALEEGRSAFSKRPAEVRAEMAGMTPFQRQHYQIAVADEAIRKVMRGAAEVGNKNAANALNNTELQNILREVFNDPIETEAFLSNLNARNQLLRNAAAWSGNSASIRRAAQAGDSFLATLADATASGGMAGAANSTRLQAWRALRGRQMERENDALGEALLRNVDSGDAEDENYIQSLLRELRQRESARISRARAAAREGASGAIGGGNVSDDLDQGY